MAEPSFAIQDDETGRFYNEETDDWTRFKKNAATWSTRDEAEQCIEFAKLRSCGVVPFDT